MSTKTQFERQKELARLKRLRQESFMLNPPSKSITETDENELLKELDEIDKKNNNYLKPPLSTSSYKLQSNSSEGQQLSTAVFNKQNDVQIDLSRRKFTSDVSTLNGRLRTISDIKRDFQLGDIIEFVHRGIEVILVYKLKLYIFLDILIFIFLSLIF